MSQFEIEIKKGERFEFGANWRSFLTNLNDERILEAEKSLKKMLQTNDLHKKKFIDIGSGSGLFSLAARRLGAEVYSFDFDPNSVACTMELKQRYFGEDNGWTITQGDILDTNFLKSLGTFDVVYSWGVLHHTGQMWQALENAASLVNDNGKLFIAIYNDQGGASKRWKMIKKLYCVSPALFKYLIVFSVGAFFELRSSLISLVRFKNPLPFKRWKERRKDRGMSIWHDLVDWVGGYPFEVARPEEIFDFYYNKGFVLNQLTTCAGGYGCNQFVFQKKQDSC